ncbi:SLATT domain-containing protein [Altericroceibacterium xinjiangense]|uniref:SLATT domain-containing protein n=1 Tax=Altericroceibacterium xinjiangense TaxID=762261 RepID=UPI000F7DEB0A|nr:SLATT domain-containing protein [Altericroceibacterium xinjiangense]
MSLVYALAVFSSLYQANDPRMDFSPTSMFIAGAASIIGWMQIKKFNELSASYILTAHEIGLLHSDFRQIRTEDDFGDFVNDAEQAFSREHTQWVARTDN